MKENKQIENLLKMPTLGKPTDFEVSKCIDAIEKCLKEKGMSKPVNLPVREGYKAAIEVLKKRITNIPDANLEALETIQGRAIGMLAIDFLNGECSKKVLCGVPLK